MVSTLPYRANVRYTTATLEEIATMTATLSKTIEGNVSKVHTPHTLSIYKFS